MKKSALKISSFAFIKTAFEKFSLTKYIIIIMVKLLILILCSQHLHASGGEMDIVQYISLFGNALTLYVIIHTSFVASVNAYRNVGQTSFKRKTAVAVLNKTIPQMLLNKSKLNHKSKRTTNLTNDASKTIKAFEPVDTLRL